MELHCCHILFLLLEDVDIQMGAPIQTWKVHLLLDDGQKNGPSWFVPIFFLPLGLILVPNGNLLKISCLIY